MNTTKGAARLLLATGLEVRIADLERAGNDLLGQIEADDASTGELLRTEATRIFSVCHELTRLLSLGDLEGALRINIGDADENRDVLGVAV